MPLLFAGGVCCVACVLAGVEAAGVDAGVAAGVVVFGAGAGAGAAAGAVAVVVLAAGAAAGAEVFVAAGVVVSAEAVDFFDRDFLVVVVEASPEAAVVAAPPEAELSAVSVFLDLDDFFVVEAVESLEAVPEEAVASVSDFFL
jgi:hypothetical protein